MADRVVAEVNFGGPVIESLLRTRDMSISYKAVHASRGKLIRAEPISSLYERGLVHHTRAFDQLEDQMCIWEPSVTWSPDRLDAMVFALTELSQPRQELLLR